MMLSMPWLFTRRFPKSLYLCLAGEKLLSFSGVGKEGRERGGRGEGERGEERWRKIWFTSVGINKLLLNTLSNYWPSNNLSVEFLKISVFCRTNAFGRFCVEVATSGLPRALVDLAFSSQSTLGPPLLSTANSHHFQLLLQTKTLRSWKWSYINQGQFHFESELYDLEWDEMSESKWNVVGTGGLK